jgi:ATP-binding protein involved in chromosome partitioning
MTDITKEIIEKKLTSIVLGNKKSLVKENIIEAISHKDGHVQISLYANKDNIEEIEKVGKLIEKELSSIKGMISVTSVLTNEPLKQNASKEAKQPKEPKPVEKIQGIKNIIAIASGKGGVGKSTMSINIASALSSIGKRVGILDADIHGPSIPHMLALKGKPEVNENKKIVPFEFENMKVMSIGFLINEDQPVVWRGPMVHSAIKQMATDTNWGELDFLIIDMPPGTGDAQITVSQHLPLDGAIIVSTPQPVAVNDAVKAIGMFKKVNIEILGIIENMSYLVLNDGTKENIFGEDGAKEMAKKLNIEFIGEIPLDKEIRESCDDGIPFVFSQPKSLIKDIFISFAKKIDDILSKKS